jgi:hypothetical protein
MGKYGTKWERYAGRDGGASADGFTPLDTRAGDLAAYLRAEIDLRSTRPQETIQTVILPDGTSGQLIEKADSWEIVVHVCRDSYRVFSALTRAEALEAAIEFHSAGNATAKIGDTKKQKDEQP